MSHFILNEEEVQQVIMDIQTLVDHHYSEVKNIESLRYSAAQLEAKYITYKDDNSDSSDDSAIFTYASIVGKLQACVDTLYTKMEEDEKPLAKHEIVTFFSAISLLISILTAPHKYGFLSLEHDHEKSDKYSDILSAKINSKLDTTTFNYLGELINKCPERMHEYVSTWHIQVSFNHIYLQKLLNVYLF
jgi:hypothetical protein